MGPVVRDKVTFSDTGNPLNIYDQESANSERDTQKSKSLFSARIASLVLLAATLLRTAFGRNDEAQEKTQLAPLSAEPNGEVLRPELNFNVINGGLLDAPVPAKVLEQPLENSPLAETWGLMRTSALNNFVDFGTPEQPFQNGQRGTHLSPAPSNDNSALYGARPGRPIQTTGDQIATNVAGGGAPASSPENSGYDDHHYENHDHDDHDDDDDTEHGTDDGPPSSDDSPLNQRPTASRTVTLRSIGMNESVLISLAALLQYASDPDGDSLEVTGIQASSGQLEVVSEFQWRFTPEFGDTSDVTFSYNISDGSLSSSQMAFLDILEPSRIVGTDQSETIVGTSRGDTIEALAGDDIIIAREGDDVIDAGEGDDRVVAGDGDDVIHGSSGSDIIFAGSGNDSVFAGDGNDFVYGEDGNDTIFGDDGSDELYGGNGTDKMFGGRGDDLMFGDDGDDYLIGETGNDKIHGGSENDTIIGSEGDDEMFGDDGNDTFIAFANDGNDHVDGGTGMDMLDLSATTASATIDLSTGTAESADIGSDKISGMEIVSGGHGDDLFIGDAQSNTFYGNEGNDRFVAGDNDGDDAYDGGDGFDTYDASRATESVTIDLLHNTASGTEIGSDAVTLIEAAIGGSGDDVLVAGSSASVLQGGLGDDYFVFVASSDNQGKGSRDKILDYEVGDKIDIRDLSNEAGIALEDAGWRKFVLISEGAEFDAPGQIRFSYASFDGVQSTILQGNINDDTFVDFEIELVGYFEIDDSYFGRSSYADTFITLNNNS